MGIENNLLLLVLYNENNIMCDGMKHTFFIVRLWFGSKCACGNYMRKSTDETTQAK